MKKNGLDEEEVVLPWWGPVFEIIVLGGFLFMELSSPHFGVIGY